MTTQTDEQAAQAALEQEAQDEAQIQTPGDVFAVLFMAFLIIAAILLLLARIP